MSLEIQVADKGLLEKALKKLGLNYQRVRDDFTVFARGGGSILISENQARLPRQLQDTLNQIKQGYAKEVIEAAAEEFQWTVSEEDDEIILRRYSYG